MHDVQYLVLPVSDSAQSFLVLCRNMQGSWMLDLVLCVYVELKQLPIIGKRIYTALRCEGLAII